MFHMFDHIVNGYNIYFSVCSWNRKCSLFQYTDFYSATLLNCLINFNNLSIVYIGFFMYWIK